MDSLAQKFREFRLTCRSEGELSLL